MPERSTAGEFAAQLLDPAFSPQALTSQDADADPDADAGPSSRWHGTDKALRKLGLRRGAAIRVRDLTAVVSGRHVRTGVRVLPSGEVSNLTFKAPNSVSFVWSRLTPESRADIQDAVLDSAAIALDRLAGDHLANKGTRPALPFVSSLVLHVVGTLRPVNGIIVPLLHVHCCLWVVLDETGALTLPDEATLYTEDALRSCDAVGEAQLAYRMETLGFPVRKTEGMEHSFEIAGVPRKLLDADIWKSTGCAVA
jgi:hypothetical protein